MPRGVTDLVVHPAERPLQGSVPVPSDKSIGHRAVLFSSLCNGRSRIRGFSRGEGRAHSRARMGWPRTDQPSVAHSASSVPATSRLM